jgi:hypothetical protein
VFPRTVTLAEAFRAILRAIYPGRPALADEIQSYAWLYFDPNRREDREGEFREDEVKAFQEAHTLLEQIAKGKFGLRGALDPSKPLGDIDPADVEVGKLDIFAGELRVFLHNKVVRTYRQVRCYETDVDRCVAELHSKTKLGKWTSRAGFEKYCAHFKDKLNGEAPPTERVFTDAANAEGHYRPRKEMRRALRNFGPRRPGRRPTKSAGN